MSNVVEPQITETKSSIFGDFIKNNPDVIKNVLANDGFPKMDLSKPFLGKPDLSQQIAQQQAQMEIAKQQAVMQEMTPYSGLTDKVFGKSRSGFGLDHQRLRIGAYIIIGAVVGRYVAKNMAKSTTLGMVVGGLAPLLALKLTMEYDKKNMSKQEPRQKVALISDKEKIALFEKAINSWKGGVAPPREWEENNRKEVDLAKAKIKELKLENEFSNWLNSRTKVDYGMYPPPTMPNKPKTSLFDNSKYPMECMMRYASQPQPSVVMPPEYWKKREEDWMKTNCK